MVDLSHKGFDLRLHAKNFRHVQARLEILFCQFHEKFFLAHIKIEPAILNLFQYQLELFLELLAGAPHLLKLQLNFDERCQSIIAILKRSLERYKNFVVNNKSLVLFSGRKNESCNL